MNTVTILNTHGERIEKGNGFARDTEKALRLRQISSVAGGDCYRCACRTRCGRTDADWRRKVALFPAARPPARRTYHRCFAIDLVDEGSGGCAASQRDRGDVS